MLGRKAMEGPHTQQRIRGSVASQQAALQCEVEVPAVVATGWPADRCLHRHEKRNCGGQQGVRVSCAWWRLKTRVAACAGHNWQVIIQDTAEQLQLQTQPAHT